MCKHILAVMDKCLLMMELSPADAELVRREKTRVTAELRFHEGKRAFFNGDAAAARTALEEANRVLHSRKLALVLSVLRRAPRLLGFLYDVRDRLLFRGLRTKY
jgi:hypothetical protein